MLGFTITEMILFVATVNLIRGIVCRWIDKRNRVFYDDKTNWFCIMSSSGSSISGLKLRYPFWPFGGDEIDLDKELIVGIPSILEKDYPHRAHYRGNSKIYRARHKRFKKRIVVIR